MKLIQARSFARAVKKMHPNQKRVLDEAVRIVLADPEIGALKKGDLQGLRVYKYKALGQQYLLGYHFAPAEPCIALAAIGPHENFCRDHKCS